MGGFLYTNSQKQVWFCVNSFQNLVLLSFQISSTSFTQTRSFLSPRPNWIIWTVGSRSDGDLSRPIHNITPPLVFLPKPRTPLSRSDLVIHASPPRRGHGHRDAAPPPPPLQDPDHLLRPLHAPLPLRRLCPAPALAAPSRRRGGARGRGGWVRGARGGGWGGGTRGAGARRGAARCGGGREGCRHLRCCHGGLPSRTSRDAIFLTELLEIECLLHATLSVILWMASANGTLLPTLLLSKHFRPVLRCVGIG